jgi:hypothetical protein
LTHAHATVSLAEIRLPALLWRDPAAGYSMSQVSLTCLSKDSRKLVKINYIGFLYDFTKSAFVGHFA